MDHMVYGNCGHGATWKKCRIEVEIVGADANRYVLVDFKDMETKKLLLRWIKENCGRCA